MQASKPSSSVTYRHLSGPPAMPTARAPLIRAIWPTTEPTAPEAAATTTVSPAIDLQSSATVKPFAGVFPGFGRWMEEAERSPFRIGIKASDGATERQRLVATKTQPLSDYSSPQGQNRCAVDIDGSASAHWFQRDFRRVLRSDCSVGGALPRSRRTPMPSPADRQRLDLLWLLRN